MRAIAAKSLSSKPPATPRSAGTKRRRVARGATISALIGVFAVVAAVGSVGAGVDVTPPVVELIGPGDGAVVEPAAFEEVECDATDNTKVDGPCVVEFISGPSSVGIDVVVTATASDRKGNTASDTMSFSIAVEPTPLDAIDDRTIMLAGDTMLIDVLANDHDADDDLDPSTLRLIDAPGSGTASIEGERSVVEYQPTARGIDSFSYEVCDTAGACDSATVLITVLDESDCTVMGTDGDDELIGTHDSDVICAFDGNDRVSARGGNDVVFGGDGDDELVGGGGNDVLLGGSGEDAIRGGAGNDFIDGGAGDDLLKGEKQSDTVFGNAGNDELHGGLGADVLAGGPGDDRAFGWSGDDTLRGGAGDDIVRGGDADDELFGGPGNDFLHGEGGSDLLVGGAGYDVGDAGKLPDLCASLEQRLRCDGFSDGSPSGEAPMLPSFPDLPPAEHDGGGEEEDVVSGDQDVVPAEQPPPLSS